jgi:hypothetical protein
VYVRAQVNFNAGLAGVGPDRAGNNVFLEFFVLIRISIQTQLIDMS